MATLGAPWRAPAAGRRFEVEEAADGDDALEMLTEFGDFDVAIIDLGRARRTAERPGPARP